MKPASAILILTALVLAAVLPFFQGLSSEWGGTSGYYGYKTDVPVPPLPGASVPEKGLNVVFFGYRSCGTVCPLQLINLKALHDQWLDRPVNFVFVTLDPENDSQRELNRVMVALGKNFRAVRPTDFRQAQALADRYGDFATNEGAVTGEINHGARLYVVTEGNRRQLLYASPELDLPRVNDDLARLIGVDRS
ncbi:SCO family protein [Marinobacter sp. S6332]|uniref:SCO family protein n=1 Tax=Marinobacter sp. S6332 TaxID=2926403 RepID=UPI001FF2F043|nr:SCO family protein [Marinobacter sp. S6332]MCK0163527.1 SCO family protein [Marinobacter sp. S6332]